MTKKEMGTKHFLYPQPAILAGANVEGKPNYLAIAWCGVMQATPPLVYIAVRKERYTLPGIEANKTFSINVPSRDHAAVTDYCGIKSGHNIDKSKIFKNFYGELETAPMIEEFPVNMECKLVETLDFGGTHVTFVGEIVQAYVDEYCLTNGVPDVKKIDPIIYSTDGKYWAIGDLIGKAYNIGKEYKP